MAVAVTMGVLGSVTMLLVTMPMAMAVSVVMTMFCSRVRSSNRHPLLSRRLTMDQGYHQDIEGEADTAHDHNQARILDRCHCCQFHTKSVSNRSAHA